MSSDVATVVDGPDELRLEAFRGGFTGYRYRMLGSAFEAEDAVQDTMIRAWGGLAPPRGSGGAAVLAVPDRHRRLPQHAGQRARPMDLSPAGTAQSVPGDPLPENASWKEPTHRATALW